MAVRRGWMSLHCTYWAAGIKGVLFAYTHSVSKSIKLWSTTGSSDEAATKLKPQKHMHIISPSKKKNVLKCKQAKQEMNVLSSVQKSEHLSRLDRYRGPIVWNLIPKAIKDASSLQLFKQKTQTSLKDTGTNSIWKGSLSDNIKTNGFPVLKIFLKF